jgi:F-type H+-transporting ATPase subunit delta
MRKTKAAGRYARALLELAGPTHAPRVGQDLAGVERAVAGSPPLAAFLGNYSLSRVARRGVLERLFRDRADALTWRFILFLESKKRLALLPAAAGAFHDAHERAQGLRKVDLALARELEPASLARVAGAIERAVHARADLAVRVQTDLLGGFRFQAEDRVYDYSVAGRLDGLRETVTGRRTAGERER